MSNVTASSIKELRVKSGAGMLDCQNALKATNGNIEEAIDYLRKKGLASASKKADRTAAEGVVSILIGDSSAIMIEVNSETDFVAKNENFIEFVKNISKIALNSNGEITNLLTANYDLEKSVQEKLAEMTATIGENLLIRRFTKIETSGHKVYSYIHNTIAENMGKIGVLIALSGEPQDTELGKKIAMHIAATQPKSLTRDDLDHTIVEREKNIQRELALASGKPEDIVEKMLVGRINKFYQEVCLLEQDFVMNPEISVAKIAQQNGVSIIAFKLFVLGEGIEKKTSNFAEEVAKIAG